jgi:hypothetical protein
MLEVRWIAEKVVYTTLHAPEAKSLEAGDVMPDLSSDQQFQEVLAVAEKQLKQGKIQVRFGPQGKMRFIIDEVSLKASLPTTGVDDTAFRAVFHEEIGPLLEANIRGAVDQYIENAPSFQSYGEDPKKVAARKQALKMRSESINRTLVDDELRARYLVKVSSKHPRLRTSAWEVANKAALSTKEIWLRPYATLSFETITPEQQMGVFAWFPFFPTEAIGRSESVTFDCDEGDLDDLIRTLQEAKTALRKATV